MDEGEAPGSSGSGRVRQHGLRPETWTTSEPIAAIREPPAGRRVLGRASGDGVQRRRDPGDRRTGQYSQPAEDWITATLIERRNRIGRAFFSKVLPLDRFRVSRQYLRLRRSRRDLPVRRRPPVHDRVVRVRQCQRRADQSDGQRRRACRRTRRRSRRARTSRRACHPAMPAMHVTVYLRRQADGFHVVGIERAWPGRVVVSPPAPARADRRVYRRPGAPAA